MITKWASCTAPIIRLPISTLGETEAVLMEAWHVDVRGHSFELPAGTRTDGASIPRFLWRVCGHPLQAPRVFDKYRLVDALMNAGVWNHVEAWLKETPNAWTRALMAPDISEDEPLLAQGIAAVKQLLGWTDEQVEAVLAASAI